MKVLFLTALLMFGFSAFSQTEEIFFLKNNGKYVTDRDSADFMRVVDRRDSVTGLYKITEYYPNSVRKLIATASVFWPKMIWEGPSISFDKLGRRKEQVTYSNNSPVGAAYYYYPNGRLMKELNYGNVEMNSGGKGKVSLKYKLVAYYDSAGVQLVKDGNGYLKETPDKKVSEEGNYADGVRDGVWKGVIAGEGTTFEHRYDKGMFLSGKSFKPDGKVVEYTVKDVLPKFPGGEKAFGRFISANLKYPPEARSWGISGKVIITYIVEKDGSLSDLKVVSSPHHALEEEALRVLKRSPKWEPGIQNGIPVRVKYTLPVNFSINR